MKKSVINGKFSYPKDCADYGKKEKAFQKLDQDRQGKILQGCSIMITAEEYDLARRYLALVAISGGQGDQKENYFKKGGVFGDDKKLKEVLSSKRISSFDHDIFDKIKHVLPEIDGEMVKRFYQRLLEKRPLSFMNKDDEYLSRDGKTGKGCLGDNNNRDYINYSEMEFAAMMGIGGHTQFINDGSRRNKGENGEEGSFEELGRIYGLVGARLEIDDGMEVLHLVKGNLEKCKTSTSIGRIKDVNDDFIKGYEEIWKEFYKDCFEKDGEKGLYTKALDQRLYLTYKKMFADSIANLQGEEKAYIRIVGLGNAVWSGGRGEAVKESIGRAVARVFKEFRSEHDKIAAVEFSSGNGDNSYVEAFNNELGSNEKVFCSNNFVFSNKIDRQKFPNAKLSVNFAFDGGAYVGNEYWQNKLIESGDPAAAACCFAPVSLNPLVNPKILENVNVVTRESEIVSIKNYKSQNLSPDSSPSANDLSLLVPHGIAMESI